MDGRQFSSQSNSEQRSSSHRPLRAAPNAPETNAGVRPPPPADKPIPRDSFETASLAIPSGSFKPPAATTATPSTPATFAARPNQTRPAAAPTNLYSNQGDTTRRLPKEEIRHNQSSTPRVSAAASATLSKADSVRQEKPSQKPLRDERFSDKCIAELRRYKSRTREWIENDYIPDEDIESFSEETLKLAGEVMHAEPGLYTDLTESDLPFEDDRAKDYAEGTTELSFEDFIAKKRAPFDKADEVQSTTTARQQNNVVDNSGENDNEEEATDRAPLKNIIRLQDPEDLLNLPGVGTLKPIMPREEFLTHSMLQDHNPGQLLSNPRLLDTPSVRNLEAFLNRYVLNRDRKRFTEPDLKEGFEEDILAKVQCLYSKTTSPSRIVYVFFVESKLFVCCVFSRRKAEEKASSKGGIDRDVPKNKRKYGWAGHRYVIGHDTAEDPEPPKQLAPSNISLQSPPQQQQRTNTNSNNSSSTAAAAGIGWE